MTKSIKYGAHLQALFLLQLQGIGRSISYIVGDIWFTSVI